MSIKHVSSHPEWCDPRAHVDHTAENPEHRTAGLTFRPIAGGNEITVRAIRLDNTGPFGHTGDIRVNVYVEDLESVYPDGRAISIELDLDPADADLLAAALVVEAQRVRALHRTAVSR